MALPVSRSASQGSAAERWDPFREINDLQSRTEQLMESLLAGSGNGGVWAPPVDIEETDDAWIVEAEVPGAKRKDVKVDVHGNELLISGEIKERERAGILRRRTRRTGMFEYRVALPGELDPDSVEAKIHDGVLTVRIPKPERSRPHRVELTGD